MTDRGSGPTKGILTAVDLFAGAGGISLGLEQAGFSVGAAVELDPRAAATHRRNFPSTPVIQRDIRGVRPSEIRKRMERAYSSAGVSWDGSVALTTGGPPCQGYSLGGHRDPMDSRNLLVRDFHRLVVGLESRYFVMENVPGMLIGDHRRHADEVIGLFRRSGYEVSDPVVVDASELGLPQRRRRVLIAGWKTGEEPASLVLVSRDKRRTSVKQALDDLPDVDRVAELLSSDEFDACSKVRRLSAYATRMRSARSEAAAKNESAVITGCGRTVHRPDVIQRFSATKAGRSEPISRFIRLDGNGLAPTLRAGTGPDHGSHTPPRPIHYVHPRVITVREAARLQSFPDWFRFSVEKWHAWREIGNSVPPILSQWFATKVLEAALSRS